MLSSFMVRNNFLIVFYRRRALALPSSGGVRGRDTAGGEVEMSNWLVLVALDPST